MLNEQAKSLLIDKHKSKAPKKWCVYFDDENGDIVTVTNKPKQQIDFPYITTINDDARRILLGELNPIKYCVVEREDGYALSTRSEDLRIRSAEDFLTLIPTIKIANKDINILFYIDSWKMEVYFNEDTLYKMTGKRYHRNLKINSHLEGKYDNVIFYLVKQNDPNFLIHTLEIDTAHLLKHGYLVFDMHHLHTVCGLGDMSVLTKKIFKSYGVKYKNYFVRPEFTKKESKSRNFVKLTATTKTVINPFTFIRRDGQYYIRSNFDDPNEHNIYKDLTIFLVDKNNINYMKSAITIPYDEIGYNKISKLHTKVKIEDCDILCKEENRLITFDYELVGEN